MEHEESRETVWDHVSALRRYVIVSVASIAAFSIGAHFFYEKIVVIIFAPLGSQKAIFLSPLDPITFILKIDLTVGFIVSLPVIAWCVIRFAKPALGRRTLHIILLILSACSALVIVAVVYTYYLILPIVLRFLANIIVPGTEYQITAQSYLSFVLGQLLVAIIVFQTPLGMIALTYLRILDPYVVGRKRPLVYVAATIVCSIITPTGDLLSLSLVLIPTFVALEVGVLLSKVIYNRRRKANSYQTHE